MRLSKVLLAALVMAVCVSEGEAEQPVVLDYGFPTDGSCPAPAGTFTVYARALPVSLDWSSPKALLQGVPDSRAEGKKLVQSGQVAMMRSIDHVNFEFDCGDLSIPLTGQTGGGAEWPAATDAAGLLLAGTPAAMDSMDTVGDREDTTADLAARKQ